ncbi:hypothetical protein ACLOJK_023991 [Asimina triloba]
MTEIMHEMRDFMHAQSQTRAPPLPSGQPRQPLEAPMEEVVAPTELVGCAVNRPEERLDMKALHEMEPPVYQGERDFMVMEKWVFKMEKDQKVRYDTYMLEGDVEEWWRVEQMNLSDEGRNLKWVEFLERFLQYYVLDPLRHGYQDPEGHSVSGQVRAQRLGALKALVRSIDVPSGSIMTQHQDPEGLSRNGARETRSAEGCGQGAMHYQDPSDMPSRVLMGIVNVYTVQTWDRRAIRSADLGHQES